MKWWHGAIIVGIVIILSIVCIVENIAGSNERSIDGTVSVPDGVDPAGVTAVLLDSEGIVSKTAVKSDGSYAFDPVPEGSYSVAFYSASITPRCVAVSGTTVDEVQLAAFTNLSQVTNLGATPGTLFNSSDSVEVGGFTYLINKQSGIALLRSLGEMKAGSTYTVPAVIEVQEGSEKVRYAVSYVGVGSINESIYGPNIETIKTNDAPFDDDAEKISNLPEYNLVFEGSIYISSFGLANYPVDIGTRAVKYPRINLSFGETVYGIPSNAIKTVGSISFDGGIDVTEIGIGAFTHCIGLKEFSVSDNTVTIGNLAFSGCKELIRVHLGKAELGLNVFGNVGFDKKDNRCLKLADVSLGAGSPYSIKTVDGVRGIYKGDVLYFELHASPSTIDIRGTVSVPDGVDPAGVTAVLLDSEGIVSKTAVKSDGSYAFDPVPEGSYSVAFYSASITPRCVAVSGTTVDEVQLAAFTNLSQVTNLGATPGTLFNSSDSVEVGGFTYLINKQSGIALLRSLGEMKAGSTYTVPAVIEVQEGSEKVRYAVSYVGVGSINESIYGPNIETIKTNDAPFDDDAEKISNLPEYNLVFEGSIYISSFGLANYPVDIGTRAVKYPRINLSFGETVYGIPSNAIKTVGSISFDGGIDVTEIGIGAFTHCIGLKEFSVSDNTVTIGNLAFSGCKELIRVHLGKAELGLNVFGNVGFDKKDNRCLKLADVSLGAGSPYSIKTVDGVRGIYKGDVLYFEPLFSEISKEEEHTIDGISYLLCESGSVAGPVYSATVISLGSVSNGALITIPEYVTHGGKSYLVSAVGKVDNIFQSNGMADHTNMISNDSTDGLSYRIIVKGSVSINDYAFAHVKKIVNQAGSYYGTVNSGLTEIKFDIAPTYVGLYAFTDSSISSFDFSRCEYIGDGAFKRSLLKSITLNEGVSIGNSAFSGCVNLETVVMSGDVSPSLFYGCSSLKSVILDNNCTIIGPYSFYKSGIKSIDIPATCVEIGDEAFYMSSIESIILPKTVNKIGNKVFYGCPELSRVEFLIEIDSIPDEFFNNCKKLQSIILPSNCIGIGARSFANCSIQSIDLSSIKTIGESAFVYNSMLSNVQLTNVEVIGDSAFSHCSNLKTASFSNNLTTIGASAFYNCRSLESISLPTSSISLGKSTFEGCASLASVSLGTLKEIPAQCFKDCSALNSIDLGNIDSIGYQAFASSGLVEVKLPAEANLGEGVFIRCANLKKIVFGENTPLIPAGFLSSCGSLESVVFPKGTFSIGSSAFQGTTSLSIVNHKFDMAPEDIVSKWNRNAFIDSGALQFVGPPNVDGGYYYLSLKLKGQSVDSISILSNVRGLSDCTDSKIEVELPSDLYHIYDGGYNVQTLRSDWVKVSISDDNQYYSTYLGALYSKDGRILLKVPRYFDAESLLPSTEIIGQHSYYNTVISSVFIPGFVKKIDDSAFESSSIESVTFSEGLETIGDWAFYNTPIARISLSSTITTIGNNVFSTVAQLDIPIDSKLQSVGRNAFKATGSLYIPGSLKVVGDYAFGPGIDTVYIGSGSLESLKGSTAFRDASVEANGIRFCLPVGEYEDISTFYVLGGSQNGQLAGYYVVHMGEIRELDTVLECGTFSLYFISSVGTITAKRIEISDGNQVAFYITSASGYTHHDLILTIAGKQLEPQIIGSSTIYGYFIDVDKDAFIRVDERMVDKTFTITFDSKGGTPVNDLVVGSGRTVLSSNIPIPDKDMSSFLGWYTLTEEMEWSRPIYSDLHLFAKWEDAEPKVRFGSDGGIVKAEVGGKVFDTEFRTPVGSEVSFSFIPSINNEFISWTLIQKGVVTEEQSINLSVIVNSDVTVSVNTRYVSVSNSPAPLIEVPFIDSASYQQYWNFGGIVDTSMSQWTGHSSVPLIVGDYVYLRIADKIYKLDMSTGTSVATNTSVNTNSYYHYLGYAYGMIFDYSNGKVYDLNLNELNHSILDEGYRSIFSSNDGIYSYTPGMKITKYSTDLSRKEWTYSSDEFNIFGQYGTTSSILFNNGYMYWISAKFSEDKRIICSLDTATGKRCNSIELNKISGYYLDDGWLTCYDDMLYVTAYTQGLFGSTVADGKSGYIVSLPAYSDGTFGDPVYTFTGAAANSAFVVYNGRGYVHMGSSLMVFNVSDMSLIYSAASTFTHGGIVVNAGGANESNGYKVQIIVVPYSPDRGLYVFSDSFGQMKGQLSILKANTIQYSSQAVRTGSNGELVWYTDSGHVYCVGPAKDKQYYYFVDDGERSIWVHGSGSDPSSVLRDALNNSGIANNIVEESGIILNIWGKSGWKVAGYMPENPMDTTGSYIWNDTSLVDKSNGSVHYYYVRLASASENRVADGQTLYYMSDGEVAEYNFRSNIIDKRILGKILYRTQDIPDGVVNAIRTVDVSVQNNTAAVTFSIDTAIVENAVISVYIKFSDNTYQCVYGTADQTQKIEMTGSDRPVSICMVVYDAMPDGSHESKNYGTMIRDLVSGDNHIEVSR